MLDKRFIRENPDSVKNAVKVKGIDLDVDELLHLDQLNRKLQFEVDEAQARRKSFAKQFAKADEAQRAQMRIEHENFDQQLKDLRERLAETSARLQGMLLMTPGIPWDGAPVGADESANMVIRTWGERPAFDFEPLDHVTLLEKRGWAEFARARNVAGERAYALKGDLVLFERAIHSYALDLLSAKNFTPISVPSLVKEAPLIGSGMFPKGREETYELPVDDLFLAGTGEVALVGLHSGEILDKGQLPILYAGISPCFRREIGSAGRDVRGLLRVHQFEKVEQFVICEPDTAESARWHGVLLASAERIL
jgi:seryl-tRNA synthetase